MMVANPTVIERPIVISWKKVKIGQPPEAVLDILKDQISQTITNSAISAFTPDYISMAFAKILP